VGTVTVQHLEQSCNSTSFSIATVNTSRSFVLFSGTRNSNSQPTNSAREVYLSGPNQVTVTGGGGGCNGVDAIQVVDWPGATVARSTVPLSLGGLNTPVTLTTSNVGRSFLLHSSKTSGATACSRLMRGTVSGTTLNFIRGCSNAGDDLMWERVELPAGNTVQTPATPVTMSSGVNTGTFTMGTPVDLTRTLAFSAGQLTSGQGIGETSGTVFGEGTARHQLTGTTTLLLTRDAAATAGTAAFSPFVLELQP